MPISVSNPKDFSVTLSAFDGDSVVIPAKSRGIQVSNKFDWNIPSFIKVKQLGPDDIEPTTIIPSPPPPEPVTKPPKSGAIQNNTDAPTIKID